MQAMQAAPVLPKHLQIELERRPRAARKLGLVVPPPQKSSALPPGESQPRRTRALRFPPRNYLRVIVVTSHEYSPGNPAPFLSWARAVVENFRGVELRRLLFCASFLLLLFSRAPKRLARSLFVHLSLTPRISSFPFFFSFVSQW